MSLKKDNYLPRIVDTKIERYLRIFGAILLEGPKWCGKTWTGLAHSNTVRYMMNTSAGINYKETAKTEPSLLLEGIEPILIDEWQEVPSLWDAIRFEVDQEQKRGRFILTGSTKPLITDVLHSGAGRIARIKMRPMSLSETGISTGKVSLADILAGNEIKPSTNEMGLMELIELTCRGGWPANLHIRKDDALEIPSQYIEAIAQIDMSQVDDVRRDPERVKKLLRSFARNNSTMVSNATLRRDLLEDDETIAPNTMSSYISALTRLFVIEEIPGWQPEIRSRTRIRTSPKRMFSDPSLAVAALKIGPDNLKYDLNTFGFLFENLCIRDLLTYADFLDGNIYHYLDSNNYEADVIIETKGGNWSAFEIKLGEHRVEEGVSSLTALKNRIVNEGGKPPVSLCVITGGGLAYKRDDDIYVVPINALSP
jgi:predicted AAA+ superfamily ATPase